MTEKTAGLDDVSDDHNIGFKLSEAGKVQVIYTTKDNQTIFKLVGKFVTSGEQPGDDPTQTIVDGYYLIGTISGWAADAQYLFAVNPDNADEYVLNTTLAVGDGIKVVKVEGGVLTTWYPDGSGNEYVVDAAHAGKVVIYFRPTGGNDDWAEFGGYMYIMKDVASDVDTIEAGERTMKLIHNGQLLIKRGNRTYTVMGETVR